MPQTNTVPLLQVENLKKYYPAKSGIFSRSAGEIRAVDNVSFTLSEGETLGLVGESGCGKSTLGRQIVGLEPPTGGRILYQGKDLATRSAQEMKSVRTQLQMVFQDSYSSLNPRKHIYEILAEPMLYHGLADKHTIYGEILRLLDMVGLPKNALGRYPHEFSGGQRQRIGIAKALSLNPKLLICDEPVSALDVSIQAQILNLLRKLQRELDLTCIFIGHGLGAVNYVSDRIAVMYLGQIVEIADSRELFANPMHPYSRALFDAVPLADPRDRRRMKKDILEGEAGSESGQPEGCPFYSRCPRRGKECALASMHLVPAAEGSGHLVSCIRTEQGKSAIEEDCKMAGRRNLI